MSASRRNAESLSSITTALVKEARAVGEGPAAPAALPCVDAAAAEARSTERQTPAKNENIARYIITPPAKSLCTQKDDVRKQNMQKNADPIKKPSASRGTLSSERTRPAAIRLPA